MQLTKYEHACFTLEKNGRTLVVDPGNYTTDFTPSDTIVGVVITHEHSDHFDQSQLDKIAAHNPDVTIVGHEQITKQIKGLKTVSVNAGDTIDIAQFHLEFFGGRHASIYPSMPTIANLGVMVDDTLYYPGDSFAVPHKPVAYLALPISAPWLKISETIDFLLAVKPRVAFPTHDALLSDIGKSLPDRLIPQMAVGSGAEYRRIDGASIVLE